MRARQIAVLLMATSLSACAGVKRAPEPDMKHLISVNQQIPSELQGHVPPDATQPTRLAPDAVEEAPRPVIHHRRRKPVVPALDLDAVPTTPAASAAVQAAPAVPAAVQAAPAVPAAVQAAPATPAAVPAAPSVNSASPASAAGKQN